MGSLVHWGCPFNFFFLNIFDSSCALSKITTRFLLLQGAGIALRPHLSDLVCCMLESLSSLEDQGLNYVEVGDIFTI